MDFITKEPINKGWSSDKKYCVTDACGVKYLLRVSDISQKDIKRAEFDMMKRVSELGIPMCEPIEFGICEEGVYSVQSWINGSDAEEIIHTFSDEKQYEYGVRAGRILKKIHSIPSPKENDAWEIRFNKKLDRKIEMYNKCELKYENGELFTDFIEKNRRLLCGRPQCYQHGDYHVGNLMIDKGGELYVIDFNRNDYGDPWEEFNRIVWCVAVSSAFSSGMVDGYFDFDVPAGFWHLLALYIASNTLSSLPWAIPFGDGEIKTMRKQAKDVLLWYDNMKNPIPTWYTPRKEKKK